MTALTIHSHEVRTHQGMFSLTDLHKASGTSRSYRPANFIRLSQTVDLAREIVQGSDLSLAMKTVHGGPFRGTYACKELVYAYAMWISPKFHLLVIRAFDAMQGEMPKFQFPARFLCASDPAGKVSMTPLSDTHCVVDSTNLTNIETFLREFVDIDMMHRIAMVCVYRLSDRAMLKRLQ